MSKRSFQVFTVLLDIVILGISFLFMVWIKPASKSHYLPTHMDFFLILAVLWLVFLGLGESFVAGQSAAALVAMTTNFFMNNLLTYRDRRLHGWDLVRGWISFSLACSVGAVANVGIATYLFEQRFMGDMGWVLSAIAGILVGVVWNYAVTSVYTWSKPKAI